jgi:hypothetical protein
MFFLPHIMSKINNTHNAPPCPTQSVQAGGKIVAAVVADVDGAGRAAASFSGELRSVTYSGAFSSFSTFAICVCAVARAILRAFTRAAAATVFALAGIAGLLATALTATAACGISWSLPSTPFMGDLFHDDYRFQLAEEWGRVKVSEKRTIPVHVTFSPIGDRTSPILGRDWQFALFDAICVKETDSTYLMRLPDGNSVRLDKTKNAAVWKGANWIAQVAGRTITAKSSCGWEATYYLGRLQRVKTPGGDTLDFITDLGKGTRTLKANGRPVLTLRPDFDKSTTQKLWHLNFGDKHAILKMGKRPFLVKVLDYKTNKPVERKAETDTLVAKKFDGEIEETYRFGEDELIVNRNRYCWDKKTYMLTQGDMKKFSFPVVKGIRCLKTTFADGSVTISGSKEGISIWQDQKTSLRIMKTIHHPSNPGIPVPREVSRINKDGREELLTRIWYDINGDVIRTWQKDGDCEYIREERGNKKVIREGKTNRFISESEFDGSQRLSSLKMADKIYFFHYLKEEKVKIVRLKNNSSLEKVVSMDEFNLIVNRLSF